MSTLAALPAEAQAAELQESADLACFLLQMMEAAMFSVASGGEISTHAIRYIEAHPGAAARAVRFYQATERDQLMQSYRRQSRRVREMLS